MIPTMPSHYLYKIFNHRFSKSTIQFDRLMLKRISNFAKVVWKLQSARYKKKGLFNFTLALFFAYLYVWCFPLYMKSIWPEHVEDPLWFQLSIMLPMFPISLLIGTLMYLPGYLGVKWFKQYEVNPAAKKQWEKEDWPTQKKRTLKYLFLDYCVVIPVYICAGLFISGPKMRLEGFPSHLQIIKTFLFVLVVDDFLFMWLHRLMHEVPGIYKYHKLHHEYKTVASYTALYLHPVEEIVNLICLGTLIFAFIDVHFFTWIFWSTFKLFGSQEIHSGYIFPWSPLRIIPFYYETSYHFFHHEVNLGNYAGNIYIFELMLGTNKLFIDQELAKIDAKKQ